MDKYFETLELHKILDKLVEHCSNEQTKNMAKNIKPSSDLLYVQREMLKTQTAFELSVKYGTPSFINFKDISSSLKRADSGASLSLRELLDIARVLYQIRILDEWKADIDNQTQTVLDNLFEQLHPLKRLEERISTSILNENEIADCASAQLASIRKKILKASSKIKDTLNSMIKSSTTQKFLQENIVTMRDGRYVLPVKSEHKKDVAGLVHDTSSSGATYFIEPMSIVEANNEIKVLLSEEQDEIERIISELSAECSDNRDVIQNGINACAILNLYFAKSELGVAMNASIPEIADDGIIVLKKARHPLIDKNKVVPIDFSLGTDYNVMIITGPNTGGKTVVLKTVGLLTLMMMCGLMIPVSDGSKMSVFRNILVDIGDNQSIENSLSTFSSHIIRVIDILDTADEKSLVLLDELGSGTDPVEGSALAVSIIEQLIFQKVKMVTTTHYQELKIFAIETPGVENASCEFSVETLQPTYKLIIGSPGKSNAFAISQQLGVPEYIIKRAQSLISDEDKNFETVIERLDKARIELEESLEKSLAHEREVESLRKQLTEERDKLLDEKDREIEKAKRDANAIVSNVTRQANALIDELNSIKKEKDKDNFAKLVSEAKSINNSTLDKIHKEANPESIKQKTYVLPRPLAKGDKVIITDTNSNGIVVTPPDSSGLCVIQAGIMKTKISVDKLKLVEKEKPNSGNKPKPQSKVSTSGVQSKMVRSAALELDIRGFAADDGIYETDSFIDNAVMSGRGTVVIIHGKGTGILKNAIRNHLKHHPNVKSFRKGLYGEGEDGVTVVELK